MRMGWGVVWCSLYHAKLHPLESLKSTSSGNCGDTHVLPLLPCPLLPRVVVPLQSHQ